MNLRIINYFISSYLGYSPCIFQNPFLKSPSLKLSLASSFFTNPLHGILLFLSALSNTRKSHLCFLPAEALVFPAFPSLGLSLIICSVHFLLLTPESQFTSPHTQSCQSFSNALLVVMPEFSSNLFTILQVLETHQNEPKCLFHIKQVQTQKVSSRNTSCVAHMFLSYALPWGSRTYMKWTFPFTQHLFQKCFTRLQSYLPKMHSLQVSVPSHCYI